jgi:hypothetical protein
MAVSGSCMIERQRKHCLRISQFRRSALRRSGYCLDSVAWASYQNSNTDPDTMIMLNARMELRDSDYAACDYSGEIV